MAAGFFGLLELQGIWLTQEAIGLDLFNPQLKSLKQEYHLQLEKQEYQIASLKQEGQIKWLQ